MVLGTKWLAAPTTTVERLVPGGTDITDVDTVGRTLFVSLKATSTPFADLFVVDVNSIVASMPVVKVSLNTGPGLSALDATQDFVYAANVSRNAQLQIIDVRDPYSPVLVSSLKLPGVYTDATVGQSIFYYNDRIYLGTNKSQIQEFHIIDVSDPVVPVELGAYEVGAGINSIYVKGSNAYIATPNPEELTILDVSNPAAIVRVGGFDAPKGLGNGKVVAILGRLLFLGRTIGARELYVLDISDARAPRELSSYDLNTSVYSMRVSESRLFLVTSDSAREFQVFTFDSSGILTRIREFDLPARMKGLDLFDNGLIIADETVGNVRVITP